MDNRQHFVNNKDNRQPNTPDADLNLPPSYEPAYAAANRNDVPSAPPSIPPSEFSYGSIQPQPVYSYQNAQYQYQHQQYEQGSEPTQRYTYIIKSKDRGDRHFPVNAALFTLGFLCPPLWFVGCCWKSHNVYENAWRKANIFMTILFLIAFSLFVALMTLLMLEEGQNLPPANPGDLPKLPPI